MNTNHITLQAGNTIWRWENSSYLLDTDKDGVTKVLIFPINEKSLFQEYLKEELKINGPMPIVTKENQ